MGLATIWISLMSDQESWDDKIEVTIGDLGEVVVDKYIMNEWWTAYCPNKSQSHAFDRLVATMERPDKFFIVEVKTKPMMKYYPESGFNLLHYNRYKAVEKRHNLTVFIYFVDYVARIIYGGKLSDISCPHKLFYNCNNKKGEQYPRLFLDKKGKDIIMFPVELMEEICELTDEEVAMFDGLSERNY